MPYAECTYAECSFLNVFMLNLVVLNVVKPNVSTLSVVIIVKQIFKFITEDSNAIHTNITTRELKLYEVIN
jgi:hypothetical protein